MCRPRGLETARSYDLQRTAIPVTRTRLFALWAIALCMVARCMRRSVRSVLLSHTQGL